MTSAQTKVRYEQSPKHFTNVDPFQQLSKKERFGSAKLLGNKNLAYGEITYATLHKVIMWIEK